MNIVRKARRKLKLSQKYLAKKCEIDQSSISRIEKLQELPTEETIKKIAEALQICPADIQRTFYCKNCYRVNCSCRIK